MATAREILEDLIARVGTLEAEVAQLKQQPADSFDWDADLDLEAAPLVDAAALPEVDLSDLDPEQAAAVEAARQRLANETGGVIDAAIPEGTRAVSEVGSDKIDVTLPTPDVERMKQRAKLAAQLDISADFPDGNSAFIVGGPLWLYYGNRDYVMGLPFAVQKEMVKDVEADSPQEAYDMARDLFSARGEEARGPGSLESFDG